MKRFIILLLCLCTVQLLIAQWSFPGTNPYTGSNNVTIKNSDPDIVLERTGTDNSGEASLAWRDSGGTEAYLSYDYASNEFFLGNSNFNPNVSAMTLTLGGLMELRGGGTRGLNFMDGNTQDGFIRHNTNDLFIETNVDDIILDAESEIRFNTNDIQKAMFTTAGEFLVGTASAKEKLTVENGRIAVEAETSGGFFPTTTTGYDMYNGSSLVGSLSYGAGGLIIVGGAPNTVSLRNANGGATTLSTAGGSLTLRESGRVGINDSTPSFDLDVNGDGNFTGELTAASDLKLKRNIVSIAGATETINQLNPVTYEFRSDEFPDLKLSDGQRWGLIAQEVEAILPDLISENGSAIHRNGEEISIKSLNYIDLIPVMIKAIQEQDAEIQALNAIVSQK